MITTTLVKNHSEWKDVNIRHVISYATNEVLLQMKEITIIKHNKLSFLLVPIIRVIFLFWGHDSSKLFLYCLFQAIFGVLWLRKKIDDRLLFKQNFHESNVLNCGCSKIRTDNTCPYSNYNDAFSHNKEFPKSNSNQNRTGTEIMKYQFDIVKVWNTICLKLDTLKPAFAVLICKRETI